MPHEVGINLCSDCGGYYGWHRKCNLSHCQSGCDSCPAEDGA